MLIFEWIVGALLGAVVLAALARRWRAPYPAFLALGGMAIAFVPQVPNLRLDPELALALFLAPILLDAGYDTSLRDLKANWRPVAGLVVGAVGVTTAAVALVARLMVPDLPWAAAIALGAIVAPPDAVAALSVLRGVRLPHRLLTILEGESLLNDASALLVYRLAVAAAVTGSFAFGSVGPAFLGGVVGSVVAGPLCALAWSRVIRYVEDGPSAIILQFVATFGLWILAERLHLSGVLVVVSYAITLARIAPAQTSARLRVPAYAVWETAVFVLNVLAFVLVGIQIGPILEPLGPAERLQYLGVGAAIFGTVVAVRIVWIASIGLSVRLWQRARGRGGPAPSLAGGVVVAWSGMRGVLTIATALALPGEGGEGGGFPHRDLVVLSAFCVVLGTLVVQGITLRPLVAWLDLDDDDPVRRETGQGRAAAYRAAMETLTEDTPHERALRQEFGGVLRAAEEHDEGLAPEDLPTDAPRRRAIEAARVEILRLRASGEIGDAAFHLLEEELDHAELSATPSHERAAQLG